MENHQIEYKKYLTDSLEKEVVAFLNYKAGGTIFIGIDDQGCITGVPDCDKIQLKIKDRLISNICPNIMGLFDIVCETRDNKNIIKITLASGNEKPYYIKSKGMSESGCFIRIGSAAHPMTSYMIEDLFCKRIHNTIADMPSRYQDLTFNQLKIYYEGKNKALNDHFARNLELLTSDGKYNYLAYLLADNNNLSIRYAEYWDTTKIKLRKLNEYGNCSLIKALNSVLDKLSVVNDTFATITGKAQREEKNLVDPVALRELVINAFVHNDYATGNTPVIEQFSDRFVITSYGTLPVGMSQNDFFNGISNPKNRELMRIFKDLEFVEQLGSGIKRILHTYKKSNFEFLDTAIRVSLPFHQDLIALMKKSKEEISPKSKEEISPKSKEEINKDKNNQIVEKIEKNKGNSVQKNKEEISPKSKEEISPKSKEEIKSKNKDKIIHLLQKNPQVTMTEIAHYLGMSTSGVEKNIRLLKQENKICRKGPNKKGFWEVIK